MVSCDLALVFRPFFLTLKMHLSTKSGKGSGKLLGKPTKMMKSYLQETGVPSKRGEGGREGGYSFFRSRNWDRNRLDGLSSS